MLSVLSFFALALAVIAEEEEVTSEEEAVVTLTDDTFEEFVTSHPRVLVEFYAPWCGHCKALAPEYEKAAAAIHGDDAVDAYLAKVDATVNKVMATRYEVRGFPTLKYFTNGDLTSPEDYSGGRTEATIVSWVSTRSLPPVTQLETVEALEELKSRTRVSVVAFFTAEERPEESAALVAFAEANREAVAVGQVSGSFDVAGVESGSVYIFRDFEDPIVKLSEAVTAESLTAFFTRERFPLIDQIGPENHRDYVSLGLPLVWIALDPSQQETQQAVVESLTPYAREFRGRLSFVWVDAVKFAQHVQNIGIADVPGVMIAGDYNYLFQGDVSSAEDLQAFFGGYGSGTLEPHIKSEPVPETNDGDVFVIVGKTYPDVVGQDKDVLVEYYAPWCGHCKRLAPEYEKVGQAFADVGDIVIAKIDATENDSPQAIKGFPTLVYYQKGVTPPDGIQYGGARTADAIIEWVKSSASEGIDLGPVKTEL